MLLVWVTKDDLAVPQTSVLVWSHVQALVRCQGNFATCFLSVLALHSWRRRSSIGNLCSLKMVDDGMYCRTEQQFILVLRYEEKKKCCKKPNRYSLNSVRCLSAHDLLVEYEPRRIRISGKNLWLSFIFINMYDETINNYKLTIIQFSDSGLYIISTGRSTDYIQFSRCNLKVARHSHTYNVNTKES
jgi:hypothetical protein